MNTHTTLVSRTGRTLALGFSLLVSISLTAALPAAALAAEASPSPAAASEDPASVQACESAENLTYIVGFLQDVDTEEDGWIPVLVGAIAGLSEARQLAGLVVETYQPLVDDLIVSFEGVRSSLDELEDLETAGAQIASVGEAVTELGNAMDAVGVQLRTRCD